MTNRVAAFVITPEVLMVLFSRDRFYRFVGLPSDAKVLAIHYDHTRRAFVLHVEHESFDEVDHGAVLPEKGPIFVQSIPLKRLIDEWRDDATVNPNLALEVLLDELEKPFLTEPVGAENPHLPAGYREELKKL